MKTFKIVPKDPGSAITHFIGMILAIIFAVPLLSKASDTVHTVSLTIFVSSMILLYGASTAYHTFNISEKVNTILKKTDHMMIFILIAGSYTPICLIVLKLFGYTVQNGFLLYYILQWDGPVSLPLLH